jgi:hypothetical protein
MTAHLEGMRERYTDLIQVSRTHLHERTEAEQSGNMDMGRKKIRSRVRLKRLGRYAGNALVNATEST